MPLCVFCKCEDPDKVTCYPFTGTIAGMYRRVNQWYCKICKKAWDVDVNSKELVRAALAAEGPMLEAVREPKEKPPAETDDRIVKAALSGM